MPAGARRFRSCGAVVLAAASLCAPALSADSVGRVAVPPSDRELLRGVERNSIGVGRRALHRHGHDPYLYPYPYRSYPYSPTEPGPDMSAVKPAGRLVVTAQPADATVWVNGHPLPRNAGSTFQIGLLVGVHRLEVRAPGYRPYRQEVEIRAGNQHQFDIVLERE